MLYNPQLETFLCVVESGSFSKAAENAMNQDQEIVRVGISPMTPPQIFAELFPKIQKIYPEIKFQLIPFENTPENAREILGNLGQHIDVVAGIFDDTLLGLRKCQGIEISREQFCCAVSIHHRLAKREKLELTDLYGENLMLIHRGWSEFVDIIRDDLQREHPEIHIVDFDFYNLETFNRCENSNDVLLAVKSWESIHPLMKIIPVDWNYEIPFGLLYSTEPSDKVKKVLDAIQKSKNL